MTMSVKGLIWDYGGTLDSRGEHWSEVILRGYRHAGFADLTRGDFRRAYVEAERYLAVNPVIKPEFNFLDLMRAKIRLELGFLGYNPSDTERLAEPIARYCYDSARVCTAEALPVLRSLKRLYPMALCSNFYGNLHAVIADFGLAEQFDTVVESAVVGVRKPDSAIFALAAQRLGLDPVDTAVIGDSFGKDILPAASLGASTVWLRGAGWDPDAAEAELARAETLSPRPIIISDVSELLQHY